MTARVRNALAGGLAARIVSGHWPPVEGPKGCTLTTRGRNALAGGLAARFRHSLR